MVPHHRKPEPPEGRSRRPERHRSQLRPTRYPRPKRPTPLLVARTPYDKRGCTLPATTRTAPVPRPPPRPRPSALLVRGHLPHPSLEVGGGVGRGRRGARAILQRAFPPPPPLLFAFPGRINTTCHCCSRGARRACHPLERGVTRHRGSEYETIVPVHHRPLPSRPSMLDAFSLALCRPLAG